MKTLILPAEKLAGRIHILPIYWLHRVEGLIQRRSSQLFLVVVPNRGKASVDPNYVD